MRPRFPGMDPWLEHPGLWPDLHNALISAIREDLASKVAPRYFVGIEQRTYVATPVEDIAMIRPDVLVGRTGSRKRIPKPERRTAAGVGVIEMDIDRPVPVPIEEWFLEIRTVGEKRLITVIEVLSPTNKIKGDGREEYLGKRENILKTRTNLVEIDLLRAGQPMPPWPPIPAESPYRIVISRGASRPRAKLLAFGVRDEIPTIPIPLLPDDPEPTLSLGAVLHALYDRARFDLQLDYKEPPVPPLDLDDAAWARDILAPG